MSTKSTAMIGRFVGSAVGLAVLATFAAARSAAHHGSPVDGYRLSYLLAAVLVALGVVIVTARMRGPASKASRPVERPQPGNTEQPASSRRRASIR
jgi:hypothetical protein